MVSKETAEVRHQGALFAWVTAFIARLREIES
jgi:hypothetical protein